MRRQSAGVILQKIFSLKILKIYKKTSLLPSPLLNWYCRKKPSHSCFPSNFAKSLRAPIFWYIFECLLLVRLIIILWRMYAIHFKLILYSFCFLSIFEYRLVQGKLICWNIRVLDARKRLNSLGVCIQASSGFGNVSGMI